MDESREDRNPTFFNVLRAWVPLGASWFMLALEGPILYALVGRFPDASIALAAIGGVALPLTFIIESPILSLLSASTALSRSGQAYLVLRRFGYSLCLLMFGIHLIVAFTPVYDLVVFGLIDAPRDVGELARTGLMILSPTAAVVGYRRFNQGVLIRGGKSGVVGRGTVLRLITVVTFGAFGYLSGIANGVITATSALCASMIVEAVYTGVYARPIARDLLAAPSAPEYDISLRKVFSFYLPLALTVVLYLATIPLYSAAICRMPDLLPSLASWPVITSLGFLIRSSGLALIEVTIANADDIKMRDAIGRFTYQLAFLCSGIQAAIALTPLAAIYFVDLSGLNPNLLPLAAQTTLITALVPALSIIQCYYEGRLIHAHRTTVITVSVLIHLISSGAVLLLGIAAYRFQGAHVAGAAVFAGYLIQTYLLRAMALAK